MIKNAFLDETELIKLYNSGFSMFEIAKKLNCSVHKVVYWMDKYEIKRRSISEAVYLKLNPNGDPFKIKSKLSPKEKFLFGLGIGIYLGEGNKVTPQSLRVANTDPNIIKLFISFLRKICNLKSERISYSIVCFNDTDPDMARSYWANQLKISPDKFGKITQIPTQGKGTYRHKSQFGVCTVQGNNTKLAFWLREQVKSLKTLLPG